jgi:purine operon repressor
MGKLHRNERIAMLMNILMETPCTVLNLGRFTEMFGSAKSTLSEDMSIIQDIVERYELGILESIPGAAGGVRFIPSFGKNKIKGIAERLCEGLSKGERVLPGGYLYMLDIIYDPAKMDEVGKIFAGKFFPMGVDYVITVETKGIPLAFSTAKHLNVPLVIVRHYSEATDGASVNINYVSGSSRKIQTMVLSLKALKRNSRLLFVDDFMKGGGTAKGIMELAKEFDCEVVGIGVLIETAQPAKKLVDGCYSLLTLNSVDEETGRIDISPSPDL